MYSFLRWFFSVKTLIAVAMIFFLAPFLVTADTSSVTVTVTLLECYDGLDNDSDGLIDYPNDPGCEQTGDDDETDPIVCGDAVCNGGETCSSCSQDCGACSSGGGGGGGGGIIYPSVTETRAVFKGRAYPNRTITLLKDAQIVLTTIAGADANFEMSLGGLTGGNYVFSLYGEDKDGRRSSLQTFPLSITSGASTQVTGIFIAPTIDVDKSEVKRGDNIMILGQSVPLGDIIISVNSHKEFFVETISDSDGIYFYNFDTSVLELGEHNTKSKASVGNQAISAFSYVVNFKVGTKNVIKEVSRSGSGLRGDLNNDGKVNLVDFSIAAFWYRSSLSEAFSSIEAERLSGDRKLDLVDFSIMAFYWTG